MKTIFCSSNVEITCVEKITIMGRHSDSFHIQHAIFLRKGISFVMILPHKKTQKNLHVLTFENETDNEREV
jgi:hypothetical protein